jgi:hypothetical protein
VEELEEMAGAPEEHAEPVPEGASGTPARTPLTKIAVASSIASAPTAMRERLGVSALVGVAVRRARPQATR